jgi:hypothetical protein
MCKSCVADKATKTVEYDICHKTVQYGNYAKHKKTKRCLASVFAQIAEEVNSDDLSLSPDS